MLWRNMKNLKFYPTCKLASPSAIVSWMLLEKTQGFNTEKQKGNDHCYIYSPSLKAFKNIQRPNDSRTWKECDRRRILSLGNRYLLLWAKVCLPQLYQQTLSWYSQGIRKCFLYLLKQFSMQTFLKNRAFLKKVIIVPLADIW